MKTFYKIAFSLSLSAMLLSVIAVAQPITVTPAATNADVENFVNNDLFGGCISATNITFSGFPGAVGRFSNGTASVGFSQGLVMTTGSALYSIGPNNSPNRSANNLMEGDVDLNTLLNTFTNDAAFIEFDFVPLSNTVQFTYVWASEEYPEYVNSGYNDVFAFYLSGGPTNMPPTNVAIVPGTAVPVSIDNVNAGSNSQYFTNNAGGMALQYDGYTRPLQAISSVVPCGNYHIKIVLADVGDYIYDSAVFLKFRSFTSGDGVSISSNVTSTSSININEGCSDGFFNFTRDANGDLSQPQPITLNISGTATPGVDYTAFPTTVTIPAGQSSASLNLVTLSDALAEGSETVILTLNGSGCSCSALPNATINILDAAATSFTISPTVNICGGQTTTLSVTGVGSPTYLWSPGGATTASIVVSPAVTTNYSCVVNNGCGTQTLNTTVTVSGGTAAGFTVSANQCLQNNVFTYTNTGATGVGYTHLWNFGDGNTSVLENTTHTYLSSGTFTITHTVTASGGCSSSSTQTVTVLPSPVVNVTTTNSQCATATGTATANVTGVNGVLTYSWNTTPTQTSATANAIPGGQYAVTVTTSGGCSTTANGTVQTVSSLLASISSTTPTTCGGGNSGTATATGVSGVPPYTYSWNTTPAQTTATAIGLNATTTYTVTVRDAGGCIATTSTTISQSNVLPVNTTGTNPACNGGTSGTVSAFPQGGTAPYTVSWSNGGTTATLNNVAAGTYTVTINDNGGCSGTSTVTLTQPTLLSVSLTTTPISCAGGSNGTITAAATGGTPGYTYLWGNGQTTVSLSNQISASYSMLVTDARGCTANASATISQPQTLSAAILNTTNIACFGQNNGVATVTANGGTSPYTYLWSNGQTAQSANNLAAGLQSVTVTDARGCTATASTTITQPPQLVASIASFTNLTCNSNNNGGAKVLGNGGIAPYTYLWSNGQTAQDATGLTAGTYTVVVTDFRGCEANTSVTISNSPGISVSLSKTDVSCFGFSDGSVNAHILNGQTPFFYSWSNGQSLSSDTNLVAGTYSVTITDANNCVGTATAIVNEPPPLTVLITAITNASCPGETDGIATSLASGGQIPYFYQWSNGQNNATATGLAPGQYTVTTTDLNGCTANTTATIISPSPVNGVVTVSTGISCFGGNNGQLTVTPSGGTGAFSYLWNDGQTLSTATNLNAGSYSVIIQDANNCELTLNSSLTQPPALSNIFSDILAVKCNGGNDGSVTALASGGTAPYSFVWNNGQTINAATAFSAGLAIVTITDNNGCTLIDTADITEPALLIATPFVINNVLCNGQSNGSAGIGISGGVGPYNIFWGNGETGSVSSSLSSGNNSVTVTDNNLCTSTVSFQVLEPSALQITLLGTRDADCFNSHSGEAYLQANGGTQPYAFSWDNGETNDTARILIPGPHTAFVVDSAGCNTTIDLVIGSPAAISASFISLSNPFCTFDSTGSIRISVIGGTSPYQINWNDGQNGLVADSLIAGNYTATITDANSCLIQIDTFLNDPQQLNIASIATSNVTCAGANNGTLAITAEGGTTPYGYIWSNAQTSSSITGLSPGVYGFAVTDANGCITSDSSTITEPDSIQISVGGFNQPSCFGLDNGSAVATISGGIQPYSFLLNNVSFNGPLINGLANGNYVLTLVDSNQCRDTVSFSISQPNQAFTVISGTDSICFGNSAILEVNANGGNSNQYTYSWPVLSSADTIVSVTPINSTNYSAIATDFNGCIAVPDTFLVTVVSLPNITFSQSITASCGYPVAVQFNSTSPAINLAWTFSNNQISSNASPEVLFDTTGIYTITLSGSNSFGCSDTTTSVLNVSENPVASFTGGDTACSIANVQFTNLSTNANSYLWILGNGTSSNEFSPEEIYSIPGNYQVTLIASNGDCTDTFSVANAVRIFMIPTADFTATPGDSGLVSFNSTSAGAQVWLWDFDGLDSSNVQNPSYTFPNFGDYEVMLTVTNSIGCSNTKTRTVNVELFKNLVVPNALIVGGDGETAIFLPKGNGLKDYVCSIYDKWGNQIWLSDKLLNGRPAEGWNGYYQGTPVQAGTYVWKIEARFEDGTRWNGILKDSSTNQSGPLTVLR